MRRPARRSSRAGPGLAVAALLALSACASAPDGGVPPPTDPYAAVTSVQPNDPAEAINRQIYRFNRSLRRAVISPMAKLYNAPEFASVRTPLSNALSNLQSPVILINDLAQGRVCAAGVTLGRFLINSTLGLGGMIDVALKHGDLKGHGNGVTQTMAVWGVPEGPYLMLPILGPGNLRSATGFGIEFLLDPVDSALAGAGLSEVALTRDGLGLFDEQAGLASGLDKLDANAVDGYAALRSAFRQAEAESRVATECPQALLTPAPLEGARVHVDR